MRRAGLHRSSFQAGGFWRGIDGAQVSVAALVQAHEWTPHARQSRRPFTHGGNTGPPPISVLRRPGFARSQGDRTATCGGGGGARGGQPGGRRAAGQAGPTGDQRSQVDQRGPGSRTMGMKSQFCRPVPKSTPYDEAAGDCGGNSHQLVKSGVECLAGGQGLEETAGAWPGGFSDTGEQLCRPSAWTIRGVAAPMRSEWMYRILSIP